MSFGQFQFRRGTAAQWTSANPTLLSGEFGLETDTAMFKIGDGTNAWNTLGYGGLSGQASYTDTTANFTVPAVNSNVTIAVTNTGFMSADAPLFIEGAGAYLVVTVNNVNSVTVKNTGATGNAAPSTIINSGAMVAAAGVNGVNGTNGQGVPTGGTAGQYLRKSSGTDYDTAFAGIAVSEVTGAVSTARTLTAGAGLTGGGDLSTNRTFDVQVDNVGIEVPVDTLQLKNSGVTNAKMADMTQATVKGRAAGAGTGAPTDLTQAQTTALINPATANTSGGRSGSGGLSGAISAADQTSLASLLLNGAIYNVKDYGAVANDVLGAGGTDNTAAIQAAIDAAQTAGGGIVFFPAGNYSIQTGLTVRSPGVHLMGVATSYTADVGDYRAQGGSWISWRGSAGGTMLDVFPQSGASVNPLFGFRISGLNFDGRDLQVGPTDTGANPAGIGIRMRACAGAHLSDFFLNGPFTTAALDLGALTAGTIGGTDSHGTVRCIFERFCIRQLDGVVTPGIGIRFGGTTTANVNFCKFDTFQVMYRNNSSRQPAIQLGNSDSNTFLMGACNSNGALNTNWGIEILGGATAPEVSRANIFYHCSPGSGGAFIAGTALGRDPLGTAVAGLNFTSPATDNQFRPQSTENGEPVPVFGTGATGGYGITGGSTGPRFWGEGSTLVSRSSSTAAIANTETQVLGLTVPANFMKLGTVFKVEAGGLFTNTLASNSIYRIRVGATTLTGATPAAMTSANGGTARTNIPFSIAGMFTVTAAGAAGTAIGYLTLTLHNTVQPVISAPVTAAVAVDTTVARVVELTFISGAATTTATFHSAAITLVNQ